MNIWLISLIIILVFAVLTVIVIVSITKQHQNHICTCPECPKCQKCKQCPECPMYKFQCSECPEDLSKLPELFKIIGRLLTWSNGVGNLTAKIDNETINFGSNWHIYKLDDNHFMFFGSNTIKARDDDLIGGININDSFILTSKGVERYEFKDKSLDEMIKKCFIEINLIDGKHFKMNIDNKTFTFECSIDISKLELIRYRVLPDAYVEQLN